MKHWLLRHNYFLWQNDSSQRVEIHSCIQQWGIPVSSTGVFCHCDNFLKVTTAADTERELYFPYPEPGAWYISMMARCYSVERYGCDVVA